MSDGIGLQTEDVMVKAKAKLVEGLDKNDLKHTLWFFGALLLVAAFALMWFAGTQSTTIKQMELSAAVQRQTLAEERQRLETQMSEKVEALNEAHKAALKAKELEAQKAAGVYSESFAALERSVEVVGGLNDPATVASIILSLRPALRQQSVYASPYLRLAQAFEAKTGIIVGSSAWEAMKKLMFAGDGWLLQKLWGNELSRGAFMVLARENKHVFASLAKHPGLFTHAFPEYSDWRDLLNQNVSGAADADAYAETFKTAFGTSVPQTDDWQTVRYFIEFLGRRLDDGGEGTVKTVSGIIAEICGDLFPKQKEVMEE